MILLHNCDILNFFLLVAWRNISLGSITVLLLMVWWLGRFKNKTCCVFIERMATCRLHRTKPKELFQGIFWPVAKGRIHRRKVRDLWSGISSKTTFSSWFVSCLDQIIQFHKSELSLVQSLLIQPIRWSRYLVEKETSRWLSNAYFSITSNY